jgi:hypothetical protein
MGFLADRIAQQLRQARAAAAEQQRLAGAAPPRPPARPQPPSRPTAAPLAASAPSTPRPGPSPAPRRLRADADDGFPTRVVETVAVTARPVAANPLLAAFAGGATLLGGLILAEALAPPVALREPSQRR